MIAHLRDVHRVTAGGKTDSTSKGARIATPYPPRSERRKAIMWKLSRWMLVSKRPFNVVESEEFRQFCAELDPRFVVPTRTTVRNVASRIYQCTLQAVKSAMAGLWRYYPSYTSDMWSALDGS